MQKKYNLLFDVIALDITNRCNVRCPFCFSDHSLNKIDMDEKTFKKSLALLPFVSDGLFLLSCLYEPLLHPNFINYLYTVPEQYRKKIMFSTNLSVQIPDDDINKLVLSGIHHINISVDSFNPETFSSIRRGGEFEIFYGNLKKLLNKANNTPESPDIYFTTVVNRLNYNEIVDIIKKCYSMYKTDFHEIRDFIIIDNKQDWGLKNKISLNDWISLKKKIGQLSVSHVMIKDHIGFGVVDQKKNKENIYFLEPKKSIRILPDGFIEILGSNVVVDMNMIDNMSFFPKTISLFMDNDRRKTLELQKIASELIRQTLLVKSDEHISYYIEDILFDSISIMFKGWCYDNMGRHVNISILLPDKKSVDIDYEHLLSPDVEKIHGQYASKCRFCFYIPIDNVYRPMDLEKIQIDFKSF